MKRQNALKTCVILTIFAILMITFPGQANESVLKMQETNKLDSWIFPNPGPMPENAQDYIWVVRVYFNSRQEVADLAAWIEPWEVNYLEGFLVVGVSQEDYERLKAEGYFVEIDHKLTRKVNLPFDYLPNQVNGIPGYACYRTVEETYASAEEIVTSYPSLAEWIDIGDSWEKVSPGGAPGYDLMVLKLTNQAIIADKPKLFIMTAVHAREFATAELNTRFAEYLVENYNIDPDITWLLDTTEIHLLLQSNPDGRKQAETGLSWRKNTNENYCSPTSTSRGADLNRNFEFQWGCCGGSSGVPCDLTYRGPAPASEPETQAIQNYLRAIFPDQRGSNLTDAAPEDATGVFLDIHAYGELVIWAWGFTYTVAPNGIDLQTLGRKFAYFNDYEPFQAVGLYPTDGSTDDFAYGDLGIAAYSFELGTSFFQDCATFETQIIPDNLPALMYAAKSARTPYMTPAGPDVLNLNLSPLIGMAGDLITLEATINDIRYNNENGVEPTQNIAAANYYIDIPPWESGAVSQTLSSTDGVFDQNIEAVSATIDTSGLSTGQHTIFVQGQDAQGNWGAVSAAFLYIINPPTAPVIQGFVREAVSDLPLSAKISANGIFETNTDPTTGFYQMNVISGTYNIEVTANNYSEKNATIIVQDGETIDLNFSLLPICSPFEDDVESGSNGWTAQSPWSITSESAHSPANSWTDSPGGNYENALNISLTSPILDLTGFSDIYLDFWQICQTEPTYDFCHVEVSKDGGATWIEIGIFDGPQSEWENLILPTPVLDNQPDARIRFRLTTDYIETTDGWHLDDIQVLGASLSCLSDSSNFKAYLPVVIR